MDYLDKSQAANNLVYELPELNKYSFYQLFDIDQVQQIQDSFSEATGVASIITEIDGTPITRPSCFSVFCNEIIRKTEKGLCNCMKSDAILGSPDPYGPRQQRCLSGGLIDGGTSIMVGSHHVANWLIGQVLDEDADINEIYKYCEEIGADYYAFDDALKKVNRMPKERFANICNFLYLNAKMLSSMAIKNIVQQEEIALRKRTEDALRISEEKYRLLTEFASDVIWVLNLTASKFTYFSPSIYHLRGLTVEEALKESIEESLAPESLKQAVTFIENGIREFLCDPDSFNPHAIEVKQPCKDGSVIWVEVSGRFRRNIDGDLELVGASRNIDKRKIAEEEVLFLSYKDQLTKLSNRRFYEEELEKIDTADNLPLTLVMVDVNGLKLTNDAFGHNCGDALLLKTANVLSEVCKNYGTIARIGGDEFVLILPNCSHDKADSIIFRINEAIAAEKTERIILSVSIGFAVKNSVSEDINDVFRKAEDSMYKNKLYESSNMRRRTIDIIMKTLCEKNNREMLHSKRVGEICGSIAVQMNFDEDDIHQMRLAGLMHDIGKIGIEETILKKPGNLNSIEWNEIYRHSEIGYRILSSVNEFSEIAEYVLAHHERWDGNGYPKGLRGKEIPLKSRIIAIADSYEAMTSDRIYSRGLSQNEAVKEIIRCSNTQFDANIAKTFVEKVLGAVWE